MCLRSMRLVCYLSFPGINSYIFRVFVWGQKKKSEVCWLTATPSLVKRQKFTAGGTRSCRLIRLPCLSSWTSKFSQAPSQWCPPVAPILPVFPRAPPLIRTRGQQESSIFIFHSRLLCVQRKARLIQQLWSLSKWKLGAGYTFFRGRVAFYLPWASHLESITVCSPLFLQLTEFTIGSGPGFVALQSPLFDQASERRVCFL